MALINTASQETATGPVREGYEMYLENFGIIPKPMELLSASPDLFSLQLKRLRYYANHPRLSFALLTHIRYLVAHNLNYAFCMDFNQALLKRQGLGEEELKAIEEDPANSMLEENENAILAFVIKAVKEPKSVDEEEIGKLKNMGWQDRDLVDALAHGVNMIDHFIMMDVFKMDQNCLAATEE